MKSMTRFVAATVLIAAASTATAQTTGLDAQVNALDKTGAQRGQALVAGKIASNFTTLAGSEENALALVKALRTGETVKLTYAPTGTSTTPSVATLDPPTGHMGWGNVKISLALAQDQLARLGIANPTAEQLQAALNGGSVTVTSADGTTTTSTLKGVLQMRADGMGWGNIAKAGGTKVGPVVSQLEMANVKVASIPVSTSTTAVNTSTTKATGVTTAAGISATTKGKGITTANGVAATASHKGLTTAQGATASSHGNAHGRGIVTAAGSAATNSAATFHDKPAGVGVVTGTSAGASSTATGNGNAGGNGRGNGADHGKGKGA